MDSMGLLTAVMTAELLQHDKMERREKILAWLWKGDYWKRHKNLRDRRVPKTGKWFLECDRFKDWRNGLGSPLLLCLGMGKNLL